MLLRAVGMKLWRRAEDETLNETYLLDQHHVHRTWPRRIRKKDEWLDDWNERMDVERQKRSDDGRPLLKIHRSKIFNSPPRTLHQFGYRIVLLECERFLSLSLSLSNALNAIGDGSIELRSLETSILREWVCLFSAALSFLFLIWRQKIKKWARAFWISRVMETCR